MPLPVTKVLSLRATNESVAIRRSRCESEARGNLQSSLALLVTRLRRFTPRNDISLNRSRLGCPIDPIGLQGFDEGVDLVSRIGLGIGGNVDDIAF
jgi:hypothetical protein